MGCPACNGSAGLGVVLDSNNQCVNYRWLPFVHPIPKLTIDQQFDANDLNHFGLIRFDRFWLFEISQSSFSKTVGAANIAWQRLYAPVSVPNREEHAVLATLGMKYSGSDVRSHQVIAHGGHRYERWEVLSPKTQKNEVVFFNIDAIRDNPAK